jgi:RimJ/RimL family protein N-acetyltransferase
VTSVASELGFHSREVVSRDGRRVILRAASPEDRDEVQAFLKRLTEQSRYSRFMSSLRELSPAMLERAVHPEQGRELQIFAVCGEDARQTIVGGARYSGAAGSKDCEFALTVADDWQGRGLARQLLEALMAAAHTAGFERMEGYILASNTRMLGLARRLGFERLESPEGPTVHLLRRELSSVSVR